MTKNTSQQFQNKYILPEGMSASLQLINPATHPKDGPAMKDIHDLIEHEARTLGANVQPEGFTKLNTAIQSNQIKVFALDVSYPNSWPERVGAIIVLPTVYTEWDSKEKSFKTKHAVYVEDTAVVPDASAKFRRNTVIDAVRPTGMGLGEYMNCELFRLTAGTDSSDLLWGASSAAYIAECGERSYAMHKIYTNLFGIKTEESGLHVVQFEGAPRYKRSARTTISIQDWGYYAEEHKTNGEQVLPGKTMPDHVFSTNLKNGNSLEQIQADTFKSLSTFYGQDIFRVVINHSERVPTDMDKLVTFYGDTLNSKAAEILENRIQASALTIDDVFRMLYVHVKDTGDRQTNMRCMEALRILGGQQRKLGTCYMRPVVLPFSKLNPSVFYSGRKEPTGYTGYTRSRKTVPFRTKRPAEQSGAELEQRASVG